MQTQTKYGTINIAVTDNNHAHVSFSTGSRGEQPLTVRGVEWSGSAHMYRHQEGAHPSGPWLIGKPSQSSYDRRMSLFLSRVNPKDYNHSKPTEAAFSAIGTEVTECFNKWAASNPDAFKAAALRDKAERSTKKLEEIAEAEKALAALRAELVAINAEVL